MKAIELFAGAGGAALGLEAAGFEHLALCEWDPDACATLRAAGLGPVVEGDVRDLDAIEAVAGPSCDLLWSSFPCQAFSTAGKRLGAGDERNGWPWTVDAIDRFKPAWFLGENVKGLLMHRGGCTARGGQLGIFGTAAPEDCPGCYFERVILPDLRARFAFVGWWLLDAADYGVPQHRRRVILWAGPAPVVEPAPTHGPGRALPWVSMGEALGLRQAERVIYGGVEPVDVTSRPAPSVVCHWSKDGDRSRQAVRVVPSAGLYLRAPSPTVSTGGTHGGSGVFANRKDREAIALATGRRRLTVDECARLQDFPADHPWQGNSQASYRQVGNAVPPTMARVVGEALLRAAQE